MGQLPRAPLPYRNLFRGLFLLAALDSLVSGLVAVFFGRQLFDFLHAPEPHLSLDAVGLLRLLGLVALAHAALAFLLLRPEKNGPLAVVLLLGRALNTGIWLWLGNTERLHLPALPVLVLAVHDALWLPLFVGFLLSWRLWCRHT